MDLCLSRPDHGDMESGVSYTVQTYLPQMDHMENQMSLNRAPMNRPMEIKANRGSIDFVNNSLNWILV